MRRFQGLDYEPCLDSSNCSGQRSCLTSEREECTKYDSCYCLSRTKTCLSNEQCSKGELCVGLLFSTKYACYSKVIVDALNTVMPDAGFTGPGAPPSPKNLEGLTFDYCQFSSDCKGSRSCKARVNVKEDCVFGYCACAPPTENICVSDEECISGEVCVRTPTASFSCISESAKNATNALFYTPMFTKPGEPLLTESCFSTDLKFIKEANTRQATSSGNTYSECSSSQDCRSPRECIGFSKDFKPICCEDQGFDGCTCIPHDFTTCSENSDCSDGEICEKESKDINFCLATDANLWLSLIHPTSLEPSEEDVCIGVHSLVHLSFRDLTFDTHRTAKVLCDKNNSCATRGHMVWFNGKPMMMRSYCDQVGCSEKKMLVNSPRRKAGLRLESETNGLQFSAYAARYGTETEEGVLGIVMRVGF